MTVTYFTKLGIWVFVMYYIHRSVRVIPTDLVYEYLANFCTPLKIQGIMAVADNLLNYQYLLIQARLLDMWDAWASDCHVAGLSVGTCMVVMWSGRGASMSQFLKLGPFRSP